MGNDIYYRKWHEITYPLPKFGGATVGVWECNFIPHFTWHILYDCLFMMGLKLILLSKKGHRRREISRWDISVHSRSMTTCDVSCLRECLLLFWFVWLFVAISFASWWATRILYLHIHYWSAHTTADSPTVDFRWRDGIQHDWNFTRWRVMLLRNDKSRLRRCGFQFALLFGRV